MKNPPQLPPTDHIPAPYDGPSYDEVRAERDAFISPGLTTLYKEPLMIVEGHMQYVWDETGRRYLDAFAGVVTVSVGHSHPKVFDKVKKQLDLVQHTTTLYLNPTLGAMGRRLAETMPEGSGLSVSTFTNSGSEANDLAIMLAREYTGNAAVISLRHGYHGGTRETMSILGLDTWRFQSTPENPNLATSGYCYRCPRGETYPECQCKCALEVEEIIKEKASGKVACFIAEPIQGLGGAIMPPPEYFKIVYEIIHDHGGLCIADEVQTGLGRTGEYFWGFENWDIQPDIVTMAKGFANGSPVGACITRAEISEVLTRKHYFNTFGGNPVAMVQALATFDAIKEDNLQANSRKVGGHIKARLEQLQKRHPIIGEVRGIGLMLGIELVADPKTQEPATGQLAEVLDQARQRGLLLGKGGLCSNVIRIKPPMCITLADADFIVDCLDEIFSDMEM